MITIPKTNFGRFYTEQKISQLLIESLGNRKPRTVLELGVGKGAILSAAKAKWNSIRYIATDVDAISLRKLRERFPAAELHKLSGLTANLKSALDLGNTHVDLALCNPPYIPIEKKQRLRLLGIVAEFDQSLAAGVRKLTAEVVFLFQSINLLKRDGILGIILPDSILTGKEYRQIRKILLKNMTVISVIDLPEKIFQNTEAKTHIVVLKKSTPSGKKVSLQISDKQGAILDTIHVSLSKLENRMDYAYHKALQNYKIGADKYKTVMELGFQIHRGQYTEKQLKEIRFSYIHTTSFSLDEQIMGKKQPIGKFGNAERSARANDIILARVGRGCRGKFAVVGQGDLLTSDCIYIIRHSNSRIRNKLLRTLRSGQGQAMLRAYYHGTCAKVLSKSDLEQFPVIY